MRWPFRKSLLARSPGKESRPKTKLPDAFYVSRPILEHDVSSALKRGEHLVIYGPPRQGKTRLLMRHHLDAEPIYIECRPGFKRTQIYRVALSSIGYSVLVERKKGGKASANVKLGLMSSGIQASAGRDLEEVTQTITVDLKNPSEIAHLVSRVKTLPHVVLNDFQLLDATTKRNLLFDLRIFAERPSIRVVIVGAWPNEDYLEEIEPAVTGIFRYVLVPTWSEQELRGAYALWSERGLLRPSSGVRLEQSLSLSGGDISLFRALATGDWHHSAEDLSVATSRSRAETLVLDRFGRALGIKLKALLSQRTSYLTYLSLKVSKHLAANPKFRHSGGPRAWTIEQSRRDPITHEPWPKGRQVMLDREGNPQYIEETTGVLEVVSTDTVRFLLRKVHSAVQEGKSDVSLRELATQFVEESRPLPVAIDKSKLRAVFSRFDEAQRKALVAPPLLYTDAVKEAIEIGCGSFGTGRILLVFNKIEWFGAAESWSPPALMGCRG
jgi:hypothetical protein